MTKILSERKTIRGPGSISMIHASTTNENMDEDEKIISASSLFIGNLVLFFKCNKMI